MITKFRKVVFEHLFEKLHNFSDLGLVEAEERHNRELSDHVAESYKGFMFIHVK
jgi:hypothetical protein